VNRDLGLPQLGELDPPGRGDGESADLDSIPRQARRAAILMHRLANTPR
jgi:hypothetical protein